ncbi:MAG TPA: IclR family transcriptional regulator [Microbacterium sp.]|nr:IclR family transcriptional regulator [Microbacterium sp.]
MSRNTTLVLSVHKALVLAKMLLDVESLGVTEAAVALGVNASTAQRLLATLTADGFAVRRDDRRYVVGPFLRSEEYAPTSLPISGQLRPYLERLFERTGETVHVATLVGIRIQHLDGIEASHHSLRFGLRTGVWLPAHITSGGKALLAQLSDPEVEARYRMALAGPRGQRLDVDLPSLREQLDDVRDTGIGWNFEESEPGLAAMAVAVILADGQRAALSVALPVARFTKEKGERWAADLREIAQTVSHDLAKPRTDPQV